MTIMYVLVRVCVWVLCFRASSVYILEALGVLMGFLEFFFLWIVANLLCSCLCLFDIIVELHAMMKNISITFSLEIESESESETFSY